MAEHLGTKKVLLSSMTHSIKLKAHHYALLNRLGHKRGIPRGELDGRVLRPLFADGLVFLEDQHVRLTPHGRQTIEAENQARGAPLTSELNDAQAAMLRDIIRQGGEVSPEQLDGRIAQALARRGFLDLDSGTATVSDAGRQWALSHTRKTTSRKRGAGSARAAAIHRAVAMLETAIPPDAEVLVGAMMAAAHDVIEGYRKHARKLERSGRVQP